MKGGDQEEMTSKNGGAHLRFRSSGRTAMADGRQAAEEEDHNVEQDAEEEARNQTSARDSGRIREGWSGSCEAAAAGPLLGGSGRGARRPPEAATGAGEVGGRRT